MNLAGGYDEWMATTDALLQGLGSTERDAIFGGNAQRVYLSRN